MSKWAVRNSFIAPKGFDLFFFDYSKQEMHVIVDQCEEMPVLEEMKRGIDFYTATANVIERIASVEISRYDAKQIALGLTYGEGEELLAHNLKCSVTEARRFKKAFFKGLPRVEKFAESLQKQVRYHGCIFNPFGRVLYFKRDEAYKALNGYAQGTSADITKTAAVGVNQVVEGKRSEICNIVHDELVLKIHRKERSLIEPIKVMMSEAYPYKHVPLAVDVEWSQTSWGAKKKWASGQ